MNKIYLFLLCFLPHVIFATTTVPAIIDTDELWTTTYSPYVVDSTEVKANLKIEAGVKVIIKDILYVTGGLQATSSTFEGSIYSDSGVVDISGSHLTSTSYCLDGYGSTITVSNSFFDTCREGILGVNSILNIASSTIKNTGIGVLTKLSSTHISSTTFQSNDTSMQVGTPAIYQGGEGNAFSPINEVVVQDSSFLDSMEKDISNYSNIEVDARHNWWGSDDSPTKNKGSIIVDPWIRKNIACCSSVLFIPGFEGSRLFVTGNQLWEPNRNADVEKLMMDNTGKSLSKISVGSIVDRGLGYRVYDAFIKNMNQLVASGTIKEWKPYPYDWRYSVIHIARDMIPVVEKLASSSQTKKINIVAHSNGGLVTKALIKQLRESGKESLIDSVVFIAVPHLGTPKAIASLQYGYGQEIAKGLILNKKTARQFGYNTLGAYGLLPSGFIPESGGVASSSKDMKKPMSLNGYLLSQAQAMHALLDGMHFPNIFSITGWNIPTLSSLTTQTYFGDGTVIATSSNIFENGYFFDIGQFNTDKKKNINHSDITESSAVIDLVNDLVSHTSNPAQYQKYISKETPIIPSDHKDIIVSMYSPVDIHAYDSQGNHTGLSLKQKEREKEMDIEPGLVTFVDEEIPNSHYVDIMEAKHIFLPGGERYVIKGIGTDTGVFTLQTNIGSTSFSNIPVIKNSIIELVIDQKTSTSSSLLMDVEGDGVFDVSIKPTNTSKSLDIRMFLTILRKMVPKLSMGPLLDRAIYKKIDLLLAHLDDPIAIKNTTDQANLFREQGYSPFIKKFIIDIVPPKM